MRRIGCLLVAALILAGCAVGTGPGDLPTQSGSPAPRFSAAPRTDRGYPQFSVRGDGETVLLPAWSFCIGNMCGDGAPPEDPPSVGSPTTVELSFSEPGWALTAGFQTPDDDCSREYPMTLDQVGEARWTLEPAGPAGTYDVTLTARGEGSGGGDASATFTWTTPHPGALPEPQAHLLTDYFELSVSHLATTPMEGEVTITVTSADGRFQTIRPRQERHEGCSAAGRIGFAIAEPGEEKPTVLGAPPHTYEVRLRLDGTEYRASAVTPRDQKFDGHHPYVALTFDPPLPAL